MAKTASATNGYRLASGIPGKFPLRVLADRVLIEMEGGERMSRGGLVIPESAKKDLAAGIIVAIGSGALSNGVRVPVDAKIGDRIYYFPYKGGEIVHGEKKYRLLQECDIAAVVEG
jgi:chaperonin GroES